MNRRPLPASSPTLGCTTLQSLGLEVFFCSASFVGRPPIQTVGFKVFDSGVDLLCWVLAQSASDFQSSLPV